MPAQGAPPDAPARGARRLRRAFGLVSCTLPPSSSGQAVALGRLLRGLPAEDYCLLSADDEACAAAAGGSPASVGGLAGPVEPLRRPAQGRRWTRLARAPAALLTRAREIARAARRRGCGALVACSGDLLDLPAAYLASRRLGVPFVAYLFDDYTHQWTTPARRAFAAWCERWMLPRAAAVIVPNELLADAYRARHGVTPLLVRNPTEPQAGARVAPTTWPRDGDVARIVYTGSIYHAHGDAFRRLAAACARLDRPRCALHVYGPQGARELAALGVSGPVVAHGRVGPAEAAARQRDADALFLPLAFSSPIPEVVRTSAPGKLGEYLQAGAPLLAHVPGDSFVAAFLRARGAGLVAAEPDVGRLARALAELADPAVRAALAVGAAAAAREFELETARAAFLDALELAIAPAPRRGQA